MGGKSDGKQEAEKSSNSSSIWSYYSYQTYVKDPIYQVYQRYSVEGSARSYTEFMERASFLSRIFLSASGAKENVKQLQEEEQQKEVMEGTAAEDILYNKK